MAKIGIVACQALARELAHILNSNTKLETIYVVRSPEGVEFASHLKGTRVRLIHDPAFVRRSSKGPEAIVSVLPIGLHLDIEELEYECNETVTYLKDMTEGIVLFYGLCGRGLENVICRDDVSLFYPMDEEGIADDCVCSLMGRKRYFEELRRNGSFFITPGFALYRKQMLEKVNSRSTQHYSNSETLVMLEANDYKRGLVVHEGIESEEDLSLEYLLSSEYNLPVEHTTGSLDMLEDALGRAIEACL